MAPLDGYSLLVGNLPPGQDLEAPGDIVAIFRDWGYVIRFCFGVGNDRLGIQVGDISCNIQQEAEDTIASCDGRECVGLQIQIIPDSAATFCK